MISEKEFMDVKDDIIKWLPRYIKNIFERDEIISEMYLICHKSNEKFNPARNKDKNAKKKFLYFRCFYGLFNKFKKEITNKNTYKSMTNEHLDLNAGNYRSYGDYDEIVSKISSKSLDNIIKYACEEIDEKTLLRRTKLDPETCGQILAKLGSHF